MDYHFMNNCLVCRLDPGEEVLETLNQIIDKNNITSGSLNGIGAIQNPELGYFDFDKKDYHRKKISGFFEVLSLNGNITIVDNRPFIHSHVVLGAKDFSVIGGHLFQARVSATMEVYIFPGEKAIFRLQSDLPALKIMKFEPDK